LHFFLSYKNNTHTHKKISFLNRFLGGPPPSGGGRDFNDFDGLPVFGGKEEGFLEIVKRQWMEFVDDYNAGREIETPQFIEEFHNHAIEMKGDLTLKRFLDFFTYPMPLLVGHGRVFQKKGFHRFLYGRYWHEAAKQKSEGMLPTLMSIAFTPVSCHTIPASSGEEMRFLPILGIFDGNENFYFAIPKALTRDDVGNATLSSERIIWGDDGVARIYFTLDDFARVADQTFNPDVITNEDLTSASLSSSADIFERGYFFDGERGKRYDLSCKTDLKKFLRVPSLKENERIVIMRDGTQNAHNQLASISYIINDGDDDDENYDDVKRNERKREAKSVSVVELLKYLYFDYVNLMSVPDRLPLGYFVRANRNAPVSFYLLQYVEMLLKNDQVEPMSPGNWDKKPDTLEREEKKKFRFVLDYLKVVEKPAYEWHLKPSVSTINPPFKREFEKDIMGPLPTFLLHENDEEMFRLFVMKAYVFYSLLVEYGYNYVIADKLAMDDPLLDDDSVRSEYGSRKRYAGRFSGGTAFFVLLEEEIRRLEYLWGAGDWMLIYVFRRLFSVYPEAYGVKPNYYNLINRIADERGNEDPIPDEGVRQQNLKMDDETRQRELEAYTEQRRREKAEELFEIERRRVSAEQDRRWIERYESGQRFWPGEDQQVGDDTEESDQPPRKRKRTDADAAAMLLRRFNQDIEAAAQMLARMKF